MEPAAVEEAAELPGGAIAPTESDVWDLPVESVCLLTSDRAVSTPVTPLLMPAVDAPKRVKARKKGRKVGV